MNDKSQRPSILVIGTAIVGAIFGLLYGLTSQLYWLLFALVVVVIAFVIERQTLVAKNQELQEAVDQAQSKTQGLSDKLVQSDQILKASSRELEREKRTAVAERESRNRFWRHISHELRTPLNGIINFSHMIGLGFYGEVSDKQVNYLTRIEQSGWYLLNMLNDLSDLAKIETGDLTLNLTKVDLFVTCEEALATLHSLLTDESIEVVRDYPDTWPSLVADERRLKQILVNLLRHAAKQIEEGYIALRVRATQQQIQIVVEDTAGGMTKEQQASLFHEVSDAGMSYTPTSVSASFGLSVAKYLVEAHEGTIKVKSNEGVGSLFTITLPPSLGG
ncbi:MAG: HAMP domain-containing sensor histidine kinase [Chloroflexota bacterium]